MKLLPIPKLFTEGFQPAFAVIDLKECTVKLRTFGGTDVEQFLILKIGEGTFTWTEKKNMDYMLDRGTLNTVRAGDEEPVEWSLDVSWDWIQGTSAAPVADGIGELTKYVEGDATHKTTDTADACAPHAFDIVVNYAPNCGAADAKDITLQHCRKENLQFDISNGTIALSGRANVTAATIATAS